MLYHEINFQSSTDKELYIAKYWIGFVDLLLETLVPGHVAFTAKIYKYGIHNHARSTKHHL
jgi:hypothetical protein